MGAFAPSYCWHRDWTRQVSMKALGGWLNARVVNGLEEFMAALDGSFIDSKGAGWRARLHGIYRDGAMLWLQLSSLEHPYADLLLRLPQTATGEHVLAALHGWTPADSPAVTVLTAPLNDSSAFRQWVLPSCRQLCPLKSRRHPANTW